MKWEDPLTTQEAFAFGLMAGTFYATLALVGVYLVRFSMLVQ